ncbi:MAG: hypothetical protein IPF58_05005 [Saprospirales bacterium]|nr:hypothetical protein [Saprospirales bacterium]
MRTTTNRMMIAIIAVIFAVTFTSCKKENDIIPTPNPSVNTPPNIPATPVTPAVSLKPRSIITTENGSSVRKEFYTYDAVGKLKNYISITRNGEDSVLVSANSVSFKRQGSTTVSQVLTYNTDKTFKAIFSSNDQIDFVNNQTKLSRITKVRPDNSTQSVGEFAYTNNNLSIIGAEVRVDINYHNNLPYQKGINEIPLAFKPIFNYKVLEQENATSTVLYNKLIKQVITTFGGSRFETHDYQYEFDANNRVTKITDTVTNTTSSTSSQKTVISTISY